jgi:hypothetical protein
MLAPGVINYDLYWDYRVIDDEGETIGVRDDAPPEAKAEWQKWLDIEKWQNETGER